MSTPFLPKVTLEERADTTRHEATRAGVEPDYPFDVDSTVEFLFDFDLNLAADLPPGMLGCISFGEKTIRISEAIDHDGRRRFTVAHEIGHLVLHRSLLEASSTQTPLFAVEQGPAQDSSMEWQADFFAAALLMPREAMLQQFGEDVRRGEMIELARVASVFGVSREAARIRLEELGMILRTSPGERLHL